MALSTATAGKIVEIVATDGPCRHAIEPLPAPLTVLNPLGDLALRFTHTAGSVRNLALLAAGKSQGDPVFDERICLGIALVTMKAIHGAMRSGRLPEVRSCSTLHRVVHGIHHEATWIRTPDDSEYVFDWHKTLKLRDPVINKAEDWVAGRWGINYVLFNGFT